jgi:hypothetical protein
MSESSRVRLPNSPMERAGGVGSLFHIQTSSPPSLPAGRQGAIHLKKTPDPFYLPPCSCVKGTGTAAQPDRDRTDERRRFLRSEGWAG